MRRQSPFVPRRPIDKCSRSCFFSSFSSFSSSDGVRERAGQGHQQRRVLSMRCEGKGDKRRREEKEEEEEAMEPSPSTIQAAAARSGTVRQTSRRRSRFVKNIPLTKFSEWKRTPIQTPRCPFIRGDIHQLS
jgi:hypothetical protein